MTHGINWKILPKDQIIRSLEDAIRKNAEKDKEIERLKIENNELKEDVAELKLVLDKRNKIH